MAYRKQPLKVEAKQYRGGQMPLEQWCDFNNINGRGISPDTFVVMTMQGEIKKVTNSDWVVLDELGNVSVHKDYEMALLYTNLDEDAE